MRGGVAGAIAAGWIADRAFGDPARLHPVAGFGQAASALERRTWRPTRAAGLAHVAALVGALGIVTTAVDRLLAGRPFRRTLFRAGVVWATLGGRSLERAALALADELEAGRLDGARALAPTLVGRDPSTLDAPELSRATVESVAENTSDAVLAPLVWTVLLGVPGAAMYRAINTLDAMIGHRDERYRNFGWAAARLDDFVNWPAARASALLAVAWAPALGGSRQAAWRSAWRDGAAHPSPNAGRVEGAFAGALGVRLGGYNHYSSGPEWRPMLGVGVTPDVSDIARAVRLARLVSASAGVGCVLLAWGQRR